ncbi:MAG: hypothetical protein ACLF0G_14690 [Candidatus Brocadiia bacterium]
MDSPLAPRPILPGLRPPRIERNERDRKHKGRSFDDQLAEENDEDQAPEAAENDEPTAEKPPRPSSQTQGEGGHLLDLEA